MAKMKSFPNEKKTAFTVINFDGEILRTNSSLINPKFMRERNDWNWKIDAQTSIGYLGV